MTAPVNLDEKLDHAAAAPLRADLLARAGADICLDGRAVRGLGGLCAQVLLAAARLWRANGQAFEIQTSDAMLADLQRLGIAQELTIRDSQS